MVSDNKYDKYKLKKIKKFRLLAKEFNVWVQIFNEYKTKLDLFYNYARSYKNIFAEIKTNIEEIKNNNPNNSDKLYIQLIELISKRSNNENFKEICKQQFL